MSDIVIFGGTSEGRMLAEALRETEIQVHICVATEYGAALLPEGWNLHVHTGRMDEAEMEDFFESLSAAYCLDATHPYAVEVTENIRRACQKKDLPYIRVIRDEEKPLHQSGNEPSCREKKENAGKGGLVYEMQSVEEAAEFLKDTEGIVLITTGSKELEKYTVLPDYQSRCYARVLPTPEVMDKCRELGFEGSHIIGMQGPFSEELNYAIMKQIHADWMVTKSSGRAGGYQEKCEAALRAGANMIIIRRPKEESCLRKEAGSSGEKKGLAEAVRFIREKCGIKEKRSLYLIGMGPGDAKLLTREAEECLKSCDVVIGAKRIVEIWQGHQSKPRFESYRKEEIFSYLREHPEYRRIALVYSGDIGFYSGAKGMRDYVAGQLQDFPEEWEDEFQIHPVSGIASPIYFLNKLGYSWEDVQLVSCHGKKTNLISMMKHQRRVCTLLGERNGVAQICQTFLDFGMKQVWITVGERLTYPNERIVTGHPEDFIRQEFDALSVALFENPDFEARRISPGIEDHAFIRGKVPMTKQEIRVLSLAKIKLTADSVLYDIGAGTGSVAIEAALQCEQGHVYAVEKKPEGIALIQENKNRFGAENLTIIEGEAPEALEDLPGPTHAFIGGSSGRLLEIIQKVREKNQDVRFVITAITLETLALLEKIKEQFPEYADMEVLQINAARSRALGRYHLMSAENPVFIICFGGRKEEPNEK